MICKIRKWELSDAADLAAVISNKNIQDNLRDGLPYPYTEQDARDYITAMLSAGGKDAFAFAIAIDGKVKGSIGVFRQGNIHRQTAELGYYIAEECWGKGMMTEAVKQVCDYVFDRSDIIRIYAEPFAYNAASCRVLEKAGFSIRRHAEEQCCKKRPGYRHENVLAVEKREVISRLSAPSWDGDSPFSLGGFCCVDEYRAAGAPEL